MLITILGTANAWGPNPFLNPAPNIPMTGMVGSNQTIVIRRFRTSLLVESADGKKILVDCSPDFGNQLREFQFGTINAILITHPHLDHIGGLDELSLYRPTGIVPIPAYATAPCWETIKTERGFEYIIDKVKLVKENTIVTVGDKRFIDIGSVRIWPFAVEHNFIAPGAVGFVF